MVEKKNPDYSASAVKLCNPPEIAGELIELHIAQEQAKILEVSLEENELYLDLKGKQKKIADITTHIRELIDTLGSYQDLLAGVYAIKQLKRTKVYSATNFESCFPEYATAVLTKSINVPVLEGLIKGNLLNEDGLRRAHIIEDKESFAYIVR